MKGGEAQIKGSRSGWCNVIEVSEELTFFPQEGASGLFAHHCEGCLRACLDVVLDGGKG